MSSGFTVVTSMSLWASALNKAYLACLISRIVLGIVFLAPVSFNYDLSKTKQNTSLFLFS